MQQPMKVVNAQRQEFPLIPPWTTGNPIADYAPNELKERTLQKIASIEADYIVYTDGSRDSNQKNGGAGIYVEDANKNCILETS